jgi:hypothetical protein
MKTRQGYFTEQVRNSSYKDELSNEKRLNKNCSIVFDQLKTGAKTMHEISVNTGMGVHLVSARLNDLRKEEYVITTGEKVLNPVSGRPNSLWVVNPFKLFEQLKIF